MLVDIGNGNDPSCAVFLPPASSTRSQPAARSHIFGAASKPNNAEPRATKQNIYAPEPIMRGLYGMLMLYNRKLREQHAKNDIGWFGSGALVVIGT